ncbi:phenylacetate--CoA ligase family protein [Micromonospora sp. NPDC051925]|uniref:phenylacetate--CoA ligase family protein n=1 Tax=Micromonospora sp. NPDC051925 TaxID=3364288 RepID=UPI0037C8C817
MRAIDLAVDRTGLLAAQASNLDLMRAAVQRSRTCTAVQPYAGLLTPQRLAEAPLMTRDQLAAWGSQPAAPNRITTGDVRLVLRSSGSSGRVRTLLHDRAFNERVEALGARGLCLDGLGPNPFVVNALTPGDLFGGFGFAEAVLARRGAAVLPTGTTLPPEHLAELITDLDVAAIVALPALLHRLRAAMPAELARLRCVYFLGDRMDGAFAAELRAGGTAVRSFAYSTTETGPIGYQCAHLDGGDHHLHEDLVIAEVVDEDGRRLPDGVPGALAVTVLTETGAALVRYLVGDRVTLLAHGCPCGSPARVLRLGGRDDTSANIDGTLVTRDMFDNALAAHGVTGSSAYQVGVSVEEGLFRLALAGTAVAALPADAALAALRSHPTLRKVAESPRFRGLTVDPSGSLPRTTARGKVPFFAIGGDHDGQS